MLLTISHTRGGREISLDLPFASLPPRCPNPTNTHSQAVTGAWVGGAGRVGVRGRGCDLSPPFPPTLRRCIQSTTPGPLTVGVLEREPRVRRRLPRDLLPGPLSQHPRKQAVRVTGVQRGGVAADPLLICCAAGGGGAWVLFLLLAQGLKGSCTCVLTECRVAASHPLPRMCFSPPPPPPAHLRR